MARDYSPFTPGLPVPVEFFVGRVAEVNRLRKKVANSTAGTKDFKGRLEVAFLSGERGIGKSSLASFVRHLVEREDRVIGTHTFLGGVTTLEEMVRRIFDRLLKESIDKTWNEKLKEFFGNHIRQFGLFGISLEFNPSEGELRHIVHDFAPVLRKLAQKLQDEKHGLFVILDDINGLSTSRDFADWLKSLLDEIATSREQLPLFLLLVGLDERRHSLISHQPSLARVFDLIEIQAWSNDETKTFFQNSFSEVGVSVDEEALDLLVRFTGGLPVLAHEIGDAVFNKAKDNHIDMGDAINGLFNAADIVGRKHIEPKVFQAIRSTTYRTILRKVAIDPGAFYFHRNEIIRRLNQEEAKVFNNFLNRMTRLGVIVKEKEKGAGVYRFVNRLHHLYFWLEHGRESKS